MRFSLLSSGTMASDTGVSMPPKTATTSAEASSREFSFSLPWHSSTRLAHARNTVDEGLSLNHGLTLRRFHAGDVPASMAYG
jgi:hypothetical protein